MMKKLQTIDFKKIILFSNTFANFYKGESKVSE